jgi:TPR repeat protein
MWTAKIPGIKKGRGFILGVKKESKALVQETSDLLHHAKEYLVHRKRRCSFCGKSPAEGRTLIAGRGVYICDSCITESKNILDREPSKDLDFDSALLNRCFNRAKLQMITSGAATLESKRPWEYRTREERKAYSKIRKLAMGGQLGSQYVLGYLYECGLGEGNDADPEAAAKWYRKSAEQGYFTAQLRLAHCYEKGYGVEEDSTTAAQWYRAAADQGEDYAQIALGLCYMHGEGVAKNWVQAYKWFNVVAGRSDRGQWIINLAGKLREEAAGLMSKDQIAEAQQLSYELDGRWDLDLGSADD